MVYIVYEPSKKPTYRQICETEYALMLLSGEWRERGVPCKSLGCKTCGGDGNNKTLIKTLIRVGVE